MPLTSEIHPDSFWQDGALCSEGGRLDAAQFEAAMRHQLRQYAGRRISDFLYHGRGGEAEHAQVNREGQKREDSGNGWIMVVWVGSGMD
jgi:hypothetical protein